jgi:hypothetical protein
MLGETNSDSALINLFWRPRSFAPLYCLDKIDAEGLWETITIDIPKLHHYCSDIIQHQEGSNQ